MEEAGRDEAPVLSRSYVGSVLRPHVHQCLWKKRVERPLVSLAVDDELEKKKSNVDDQDNDAGHVGPRHGREPHLSAPQVDGAGT